MIIENDVKKLMEQYKFLKKHNQLDQVDGFMDTISKCRGKLNLSYCPEQDILKKRMSFLKFKSGFLVKLRQLEENGNKLTLASHLNEWLNDNIDKLYKENLNCTEVDIPPPIL